MSPKSKVAWLNLVLQITPIIVGLIKPDLAPVVNQLAQSIAGAETTYGPDSGPDKLKQVITDVKPNVKGIDGVTIGDVKKIVSATVDTVNLIHAVQKKTTR